MPDHMLTSSMRLVAVALLLAAVPAVAWAQDGKAKPATAGSAPPGDTRESGQDDAPADSKVKKVKTESEKGKADTDTSKTKPKPEDPASEPAKRPPTSP